MLTRRRALLAACAAPLIGMRTAGAQSYPSRTVTLVAAFPPGSGTDITARFIADHLAKALGQSVVVENKAGADGITAAQITARAPADGYTLFVTTNSTHAANPN